MDASCMDFCITSKLAHQNCAKIDEYKPFWGRSFFTGTSSTFQFTLLIIRKPGCEITFFLDSYRGLDSDTWPCCKCGLEISAESVLERDQVRLRCSQSEGGREALVKRKTEARQECCSFQEANALSIDGDGGKCSFKKMRAMLEVLNRRFHSNYYLATKLKFKIAMVGLEDLQGEDEIEEKMRLCGEIQGAHVTQIFTS